MKIHAIPFALSASILLAAPLLWAESVTVPGQGEGVFTMVAKNGKEAVTPGSGQLQLRIDGKPAQVTSIEALNSNPIELVLLIDSGLRSSIGTQLDVISDFTSELPKNTRIAVAYMQNGRALFATPFTSDPAVARRGIHLPSGIAGINSSPYFSISDLAHNWPSRARGVRRVVVMVTDGVDPYNPRFDPDEPYLQQAITDCVRSGILVDAFFWSNRMHRRFELSGQNMLSVITEATGGQVWGYGFFDPVSFAPYFDELRQQLRSQYLVRFTVPLQGKPDAMNVRLKTQGLSNHLSAPGRVFVGPVPTTLQ